MIVARAIKFAVVGLLNTAVGLSVIWGLMAVLHFGMVLANAIGYAVGFVISFAINRKWTFADKRPIERSLPAYIALVAIAYLLNLGAALAARNVLGINAYIAQLCGVVTYTGIVFLGSHFFVFAVKRSAPPGRI